MSDDEIMAELHRLRTSRVVDGKIIGQTKAARRKTAGVKALMALGLTEAQAMAEIDSKMEKGSDTDGTDGIELTPDETIIST